MDPRSPAPVTSRRRTGTSARNLRLWFGLPLGLLFLLLAALFGLRVWLYGFLRGEGFRHLLDQRASQALKAEGRFDPLQWQGAGVYTEAFDAAGNPGNPLARLGAEQIRAQFDLGALWHHAWRVESVELTKLSATLAAGGAKPAGTADTPPAVPGAEPPPATGLPDRSTLSEPPADLPPRTPGFLASLLPNRFEIGEVRIADFSLAWNPGNPGDAGRLRGVTLTGHPLTPDNRSWQIDGHDGQLTQTHYPPLRLTALSLRTTPHEVFINRVEGHADIGGHVELSGRQSLDGDQTLDLRADFDGLPVGEFLPPDWRARLKGQAVGSVHVTHSADEPGGGRAVGHVELRHGRLTALPLLDQIALFTTSERFRATELQRAQADFDWRAGNLAVSNLLVESEGLIRTEGAFTVRAGQIDGTLQVGLARGAVRWLPVVGTRVFNLPERDGYLWTTVHLSGPANHPNEDLTQRLLAATQQQIIDKAKQGTDAVIDTAKGLLDLLH